MISFYSGTDYTDYTDYAVALYNYNTKNREIRVIRA